jgi:c(7)-type cytochrome triheme protein
MKTLVIFVSCLVFFVGLAAVAADAPDKIVFETKMGNVTFDHKAHTDAAEGKCEACHDKLWPQSRGTLNYKAGMHRPAEQNKTSCGACHHNGGPSFESKGNCNRCHVKGK